MTRRNRPGGYTLLEVMLVLGILAAIAGVSWPVLMRPWSRSLAQEAAQDLTQHVLDARRRAVEESRVYRLRWRRGGSGYEIVAPGAADEMRTDQNATVRSAIPNELPVGGRGSSRDNGPNDVANRLTGMPGTADTASNLPPPRPVAPLDLHVDLPHAVTFGRPPQLANLLEEGLTQAAEQPASDPLQTSLADQPLAEGDSAGDSSESLAVEAPWSDPIWFYPDGRTSNGHWTLVSEEGYEVEVFLRGLTGTVRVGPVRRSVRTELSDDASDLGDTSRNSATDTDTSSGPDQQRAREDDRSAAATGAF